MQVRIPTDQLRVGMFVHAVDAPWLESPFWRYRFPIESPDDIASLRDAGIDSVVIDTERGIGLASPRPVGVVQPVETAPAEPEEPAFDPLDTTSCSLSTEREHAREVIDRAKHKMRGVFDGARLGHAVESSEVIGLVEEISASIMRNRHALLGLVRLKSKDEYTYLHSVAVCALMTSLARQLGLPEDQHRDLGLAGLLHDIGKMGVPKPILNKPGQLSDEEFAIVRSHPHRGAMILEEGENVPALALDVCRHHHEKVDGTGYPYGLKGEEISLAARMGAVCDVYDALTSDRVYKEAWSPVEAVTAMWSWEGQFDRIVLFAFFQAIGVYPLGLLVRTSSDALAIILPNGRRATRTRLRLFLDIETRTLIDPVDLTAADDRGERIVAVEDPASWTGADWSAAQALLLCEADDFDSFAFARLWRAPVARPQQDADEPDHIARWQVHRIAS